MRGLGRARLPVFALQATGRDSEAIPMLQDIGLPPSPALDDDLQRIGFPARPRNPNRIASTQQETLRRRANLRCGSSNTYDREQKAIRVGEVIGGSVARSASWANETKRCTEVEKMAFSIRPRLDALSEGRRRASAICTMTRATKNPSTTLLARLEAMRERLPATLDAARADDGPTYNASHGASFAASPCADRLRLRCVVLRRPRLRARARVVASRLRTRPHSWNTQFEDTRVVRYASSNDAAPVLPRLGPFRLRQLLAPRRGTGRTRRSTLLTARGTRI